MVFCNWLGVEMVMSMGQVYEMGILIFKLSISQVVINIKLSYFAFIE